MDPLLAAFRARVDGARELALSRRVVLIEASNTVGLDVALGGLPFEERLIERSSDFAIGGGPAINTCCAEDLIILKAFAGREIDWLDVRGIAIRQAGRLDEALILRELMPAARAQGHAGGRRARPGDAAPGRLAARPSGPVQAERLLVNDRPSPGPCRGAVAE